MTTDTTDADSGLPRPPRWFLPALIGGAVLLHVVALLLLKPFGVTTMEFDRNEEEQRTAEVKAREADRLAVDASRRAQTRLDKPDAEKLKQDEIQKRLPEIKKNIASLQEAKREIEELREQRFDELRERSEEDIVKFKARDLMRKADDIQRNAEIAHNLAENKDLAEKVKQTAEALKAKIAELADQPDKIEALSGEVAAVAQEVKDATQGVLAQEKENHRLRNLMRKTGDAAEDLAKEAEALPESIDVAALNETPAPATSPTDSTAPTDPGGAYANATQLEREIQEAYNDVRSAERALESGASFAEANASGRQDAPTRPSADPALAGGSPETIAELDRQREALDKAVAETQSMAMRGRNLASQAKGAASSPSSASDSGKSDSGGKNASLPSAARSIALQQAVRTSERGRVVNLAGFMGGGGTGSGEESLRGAFDGVGMLDPTQSNLRVGERDLLGGKIGVNPDTFGRETLPGRMITDESKRKGWLYIDTWYVIGPWENEGKLDFKAAHPPETIIDLDATYSDGKFSANAEHPLRELRWNFYQSDQVRCQPPDIFSNSTYFAYTELFSDRDREVLFTISTDDAAKVWLNDMLIWEDVGGSPWQVGEGFRRVRLNAGYNRLLVRIENGPIYCVWSVLFCPLTLEEVATK